MNDIKYIGLDVHQASIVAVVLNGDGPRIMESVLETKAATVLDFLGGLSGTVHVTFEEGVLSHGLYHLIKGHVARVIVCDPRQNKRLEAGNKGDRPDARKRADRLRAGRVRPIGHDEHGMRTRKERARRYQSLVVDSTRVKNRLKAIFHSQAIACAGEAVYGAAQRAAWRARLSEPGPRPRAEALYRPLDFLLEQRRAAQQARRAESRRHKASRLWRTIPPLGPVRVALWLAIVGSPHRFRTKRTFWAYGGLAVVTRTSAEYPMIGGRLQKTKKPLATRGLNDNHNRTLKQVFKGAATRGRAYEPWKSYYEQRRARGLRPELARVTRARKIAAVTLAVWKKGEGFAAPRLKPTPTA